MTTKQKLSRRSFLKLMRYAALNGFFLTLGGGFYATEIEPGWLEVVSVTLKLPRLGVAFDGLRMVQISDIHMGGWMNRDRFNHVIDLALAEEPDLIVITGDLILGSTLIKDYTSILVDLRATLPRLSARVKTLAVMGNHEYRVFPDGMPIRNLVRDCGLVDLTNAIDTIQRQGASLHFVGIDDVLGGYPKLSSVTKNIPMEGAAIALVHEPDYADLVSKTKRYDLQLSGHSHGGQVVLPFFGPLVLPVKGYKYYDGLYQVGTMFQYTTRGVGMTAPFIRLNCRPEITVFTLQAGVT